MSYTIPLHLCKKCNCYTKHVASTDIDDIPFVECTRCKHIELMEEKEEDKQ